MLAAECGRQSAGGGAACCRVREAARHRRCHRRRRYRHCCCHRFGEFKRCASATVAAAAAAAPAASYESGSATAATVGAAPQTLPRRQRRLARGGRGGSCLHIDSICQTDDAAAPVQAARHGRIAMISQESPLVIENLSLNCPCMFELFGPSAEARDCGPGVGQGPWHGVQRPAGHRFCMAIVAPAVTHALRRRRLTRPVGICEEPVEAPQLRAARRAHCRAGARFGAAGADAVRRGRKDQLHRCLLQVRVDWPSLSLWVTVSVIGRSSWLPPPPPL